MPITIAILFFARQWACYMISPLLVTASTAGSALGLLSCDVSADGLTIAAGTELHGEDASILYW